MPARSHPVFDPLVDDLAELFTFDKAVVVEMTKVWNEIKKLQPVALQPAAVGAGSVVTSGDDYIIVTPSTVDGVTTYTVTLNPANFGNIPGCDAPYSAYLE